MDQLTKLKEHLQTAEDEFKKARRGKSQQAAQGWLREIRLILSQIAEIHQQTEPKESNSKTDGHYSVNEEEMGKYYNKLSETEKKVMDKLTDKMLDEVKEAIPDHPGMRLDEIIPDHFEGNTG